MPGAPQKKKKGTSYHWWTGGTGYCPKFSGIRTEQQWAKHITDGPAAQATVPILAGGRTEQPWANHVTDGPVAQATVPVLEGVERNSKTHQLPDGIHIFHWLVLGGHFVMLRWPMYWLSGIVHDFPTTVIEKNRVPLLFLFSHRVVDKSTLMQRSGLFGVSLADFCTRMERGKK